MQRDGEEMGEDHATLRSHAFAASTGVTRQASGGTGGSEGQRTKDATQQLDQKLYVGMPSELPELHVRVVLCVTAMSTEC
jgi:hypothetical protein